MPYADLTVLQSQEDLSVNIVEDALIGFIESRYVRRCDKYFNCYLSSQTGCNRGCKFCHLTATKQTQFEDVSAVGYLTQAVEVFREYRRSQNPAQFVHYSFMARGEPLMSEVLVNDADSVLVGLADYAKGHGLKSKFNISTIMPEAMTRSLVEIFDTVLPTIYYSLYSLRSEFRKHWMPAAMDAVPALMLLKEYQDYSKKIIKIHYAFIEGENDSLEEIKDMIEYLKAMKLHIEFNVVRYNPFTEAQGRETPEETIMTIADMIREGLNTKVTVIQRVGFDVKASCGMFVGKK